MFIVSGWHHDTAVDSNDESPTKPIHTIRAFSLSRKRTAIEKTGALPIGMVFWQVVPMAYAMSKTVQAAGTDKKLDGIIDPAWRAGLELFLTVANERTHLMRHECHVDELARRFERLPKPCVGRASARNRLPHARDPVVAPDPVDQLRQLGHVPVVSATGFPVCTKSRAGKIFIARNRLFFQR